MTASTDPRDRLLALYLDRLMGDGAPPDLRSRILPVLQAAGVDPDAPLSGADGAGGSDANDDDPEQATTTGTRPGDPPMPIATRPDTQTPLPRVSDRISRFNRLPLLVLAAAAMLLVAALIALAALPEDNPTTDDGGNGANTDRRAASPGDNSDDEPLPDEPFDIVRPEGDQPDPAQTEADIRALVDGHVDFTFDLLDRLPTGENVVVSPWSLTHALGLVASGTRGQTRDQLVAAGHLPTAVDGTSLPAWRLGEALAAADRALHGEGATQLSIASGVWLERQFEVNRDWSDVIGERFGAAIRNAPFVAAPQQAREQINRWFADQTHGRIPDLLPASAIDRSTVAVLGNAVWFKGPWDYRFYDGNTRAGVFTRADGSQVTVPMMSATTFEFSAATDEWMMAVKGFRGSPLKAVFVVPTGEGGREIGDFSRAELTDMVGRLRRGNVDLTMPRLDLADELNVMSLLQVMGATDAFSSSAADFGAMTPEHVWLNFFVHKATLKADEEGCEAAGASAAGGVRSMPLDVRLDQPFLMLIQDPRTGLILFAARVNDPGTADQVADLPDDAD